MGFGKLVFLIFLGAGKRRIKKSKNQILGVKVGPNNDLEEPVIIQGGPPLSSGSGHLGLFYILRFGKA